MRLRLPWKAPCHLRIANLRECVDDFTAALDLRRIEDAAALGAWWHGAAADGLPVSENGFGLLASELADALPATARAIHARAQGDENDQEGGLGGILDLRFPGP